MYIPTNIGSCWVKEHVEHPEVEAWTSAHWLESPNGFGKTEVLPPFGLWVEGDVATEKRKSHEPQSLLGGLEHVFLGTYVLFLDVRVPNWLSVILSKEGLKPPDMRKVGLRSRLRVQLGRRFSTKKWGLTHFNPLQNVRRDPNIINSASMCDMWRPISQHKQQPFPQCTGYAY